MNYDVAQNVGENGKYTFHVLGHNVYVRKCRVPEITDEDGKLLVALCDKTRERTNWCEVLAVGKECGAPRKCSRAELKARKLNRWIDNPVKPGDLVVLPECSGRNMMWRGGLGEESELIVDESELIAMLPKEEL